MSNHTPSASNGAASTLEDTGYVLTTSDFNFSDADGDLLQSVTITSLPVAGALLLKGVNISQSQPISIADIVAGNLVFTPIANASGNAYASFGFKVSDGLNWSDEAHFTFDIAAVNDAPTFDVGTGMVATRVGVNATRFSASYLGARDMALQADGKILVGGSASDGAEYEFTVLRYNSDGSLDTSFGAGGMVGTALGSIYPDFYSDRGNAIAVQSDGKILLTGISYGNDAGAFFAVLRYNADGSLDSDFGTRGGVTTSFGTGFNVSNDIAIQADGKIVVAGAYQDYGGNGSFAMARYNSDGTLDDTFGATGKVFSPFSTSGTASAMAIQPDGKIVLGGYKFGVPGFAIARYNTDGSLDADFGGNGEITTAFGHGNDAACSITMQADGKILAAGFGSNGADLDFAVVRYNADGSLDTAFGIGGKVSTAVGSGDDRAYSVLVQADGKILLAGPSQNGRYYDYAVVRYNSDGSLDTGFGTGGKVSTAIGDGDDEAYTVAVQADGRILVSGYVSDGPSFAVVRYNSDGTLDPSFNAVNTLDNTPRYRHGDDAVILDADVALHDVELSSQGNYGGTTLTLARHGGASAFDVFSATGDLSFAGGDVSINGTRIGTVVNGGGTLAITFSGNATEALLAGAMRAIAYRNEGGAAPSTVQIDWTVNDGSGAANAAVVAKQTIVISDNHAPTTSDASATTAEDTPYHFKASDFSLTDVDGDALQSVVITTLPGAGALQLRGAGVRVGEAISATDIAAGYLVLTPAADAHGAVYATLGFKVGDGADWSAPSSFSLDVTTANEAPTFMTGSGELTMSTHNPDQASGYEVAAQPDGHILMVGSAAGKFSMVRFKPDGSADADFGVGGEVGSIFGDGSDARGIALQVDGKILLGGYVSNGAGEDFALVRYRADGSPDASFGSDGIVTTDLGGIYERGASVAVQADGKIVLAGLSGSASAGTDLALVRYDGTGILDSEFGANGKVSTTIDGSAVEGITLLGDGKILVQARSGNDLALASFNRDGSVDSEFGLAGKLLIPYGRDIAIEADGKILAGGGFNSFNVTRYDSNGDIDHTFAADGIARTAIVTYGNEPTSIAVQSDGKILVAGYVQSYDQWWKPPSKTFAMVRYNADGTLDTGFGAYGQLTAQVGNGDNAVYDVTIQADGKILLSGGSWNDATSNTDFALARYNSDGTPDTTFGLADTFGGTTSYVLGASAVILNPGAAVHDAELSATGYGGSTLTLARHGGASALDLFSAAGTLSFAGGDVSIDDTTIGTVVNGNGTLAIDFNDHATQALVERAMRAIAYSNTGSAVGISVQIDFTFNDGSGAGNAMASGHATVAIADPHIINGTDGDDTLYGTDGNDSMYGGAASDFLFGAAGDDYLDGGALNDTLVGGSGNDIYVVDNGDTVVETDTTTSEIDEVRSSVSFMLSDNVELLTLTGSDPIIGYGNALPNLITGNASDNLIDGGSGADTMQGGAGNDNYTVDDLNDVAIESSGEGIDRIVTWFDAYSLAAVANVENLAYSGWSSFTGSGNELDNVIAGGYSADTLSGGAGDDTFVGGGGNDAIDGGTGIDTVKLPGNRANYAMTKGSAETVSIHYLYYNREVLTLTSVERLQFADYLDELASADLLPSTATTGDDVYVGGAGNDVFDGLAGDDTISGNDGWDSLYGGAGNDYLDGGALPDWMEGGSGSDTYVVDDSNDTVIETYGTPGEIDEVRSSVTYWLGTNLERLTLTGSNPINGNGNALPNLITGNAGDNLLSGGAGDDTMLGGAGDDSYMVEDLNDVVIESSGEGIDRITTSLDTYSLATVANVENLAYSGWSSFTGTGNALDNMIAGGYSTDTLSGGAGDDTFVDGGGNDVIDGGIGIDTVILPGNRTGYAITKAAAETVSIRYIDNNEVLTLTAVEHVQFADYLGELTSADLLLSTATAGNDVYVGGGGNDVFDGLAGNDTISGNDGWDSLYGGPGNDYLDGGAQPDWMEGGAGNDIYVLDETGDVVIETDDSPSEIDEVRSSATYTLGDNVERLTLTGGEPINGYGNALPNLIKGNAGDNLLDGTAGADTMEGGAGNDTYVVDSLSDVVTESKGAGTDTIQTSLSTYSLAAIATVENLTYIGWGWDLFTGIGNALDNVITGGIGNDILSGGAGNDTLIGGSSPYSEDVIDGGTGNDTVVMAGYRRDYVIARPSPTSITISSIYGWNKVTLIAVEHVQFTDYLGDLTPADLLANTASGGNDVYVGDGGDNVYDGLAGNDTISGDGGRDWLSGGAGDDYLDGGADGDVLEGGTGNDIYVVDHVWDAAIETSAVATEIDEVRSSVNYGLGDNIERLTLTGGEPIWGYGNELSNLIKGNAGNNLLDGQGGADTLQGGAGDDTYMVDSRADVVTELKDEGYDTIYSAVAYPLPANVEVLHLTGLADIDATGNALDNTLIGNDGNNVLDGVAGVNTLIGGWGNDTYVTHNLAELANVVEYWDQGTDTLRIAFGNKSAKVPVVIDLSSGNLSELENATLTGTGLFNLIGNDRDNVLTGNASANALTGGMGNDVLNGLLGGDTMSGGSGDDTYYVDDAGDQVIEDAWAGTDAVYSSVSFTLGLNVENLTLTGTAAMNATGNALDNVLTGNGGANILTGGAGADSMTGGAGNDTYYIDNAGDSAIEQAGAGTDTVYSSVGYTLEANIEKLTLTGTESVNATGNALGNSLTGNAGGNRLDGGAGVDTLAGQAGNDTYLVDLVRAASEYKLEDGVTEQVRQGTDGIFVRAADEFVTGRAPTLTLPANVENMSLELAGNNSINITGNIDDNILIGNAGANALGGSFGNDTLDGGLGNDKLTGGAGLDSFVFRTALGADNVDSIISFVAANDTIILSKSIFTALTGDVLATSAFAIGLANKTAETRIVYDKGTGGLYYDADGNGAGAAIEFAKIVGISGVMTADDFHLVGSAPI